MVAMKKYWTVAIIFLCIVRPVIPKEDNEVDGLPSGVEKCLQECLQSMNYQCDRVLKDDASSCEMSDGEGDSDEEYNYYNISILSQTGAPEEGDGVAVGKPSYQSSTFKKGSGPTCDAGKANDGETREGTTTQGICNYASQTQDSSEAESNPWWQVDLEDTYIITGVHIQNADYKPEIRLHDIVVTVGDSKIDESYNDEVFDLGSMCDEHPGGGVGAFDWIKLDCKPCPVKGRYVTIQIVRYCDSCEDEKQKNILAMTEARVFGYKFE